MRNIYYTYHAVNKQRPVDVYDFDTIKELSDFTRLSLFSVYRCLEGEKVNGWSITKTPAPKRIKPKNERKTNSEIVVFFSDGTTRRFRSQRKCAAMLEVSLKTIHKHINDGKPDYKGRFYDYAT